MPLQHAGKTEIRLFTARLYSNLVPTRSYPRHTHHAFKCYKPLSPIKPMLMHVILHISAACELAHAMKMHPCHTILTAASELGTDESSSSCEV